MVLRDILVCIDMALIRNAEAVTVMQVTRQEADLDRARPGSNVWSDARDRTGWYRDFRCSVVAYRRFERRHAGGAGAYHRSQLRETSLGGRSHVDIGQKWSELHGVSAAS
jgi:hypothetical protein